MCTTTPKIHKYFERKVSEWNILGFLSECNIEPFRNKIKCYLLSLEDIASTEEGRRKEKVRQLIRNYRQASFCEKFIVELASGMVEDPTSFSIIQVLRAEPQKLVLKHSLSDVKQTTDNPMSLSDRTESRTQMILRA
ncbi:2125_t:CDS:2, partial [Funneliformis caledonium]